MEESWRGADHTQTSWGAADRCHESTAVIRTARMEGGEDGMMARDGGKGRHGEEWENGRKGREVEKEFERGRGGYTVGGCEMK